MRQAIRLLIHTVLAFGIALFSANTSPADEKQDRSGLAFEWQVPNQSLGTTLRDLAKSQNLAPEVYRLSEPPESLAGWPEKEAVYSVVVERRTFALAVQPAVPVGVPGTSASQVVLLTAKGKILDRIRCDINSRYGTVKTEVLPTPHADGTRAVVRFVGDIRPNGQQSTWHGWHTILFRDRSWTFHVNEREANAHSLWNENGLCRIGIAKDKFVVLFPRLEMPDLSETKSLRVAYRVNGVDKTLVLDDPKQVADIVSAAVINGREQHYPEFKESDYIPVGAEVLGARVDFFMPKGEVRKMAFLSDSNRVLADTRGGRLHMKSSAFYDALSKAISKTEGQTIPLLGKKQKNR
jgi:hypothetical protein